MEKVKNNPVDSLWLKRDTIGSTTQIYRQIRTTVDIDNSTTNFMKWTIIPQSENKDILQYHTWVMKLLPASMYQEMSLQILHHTIEKISYWHCSLRQMLEMWRSKIRYDTNTLPMVMSTHTKILGGNCQLLERLI